MPFFEKEKPESEKIDEAFAQHLRSILRTNKLLTVTVRSPQSSARWAGEFRKLRKIRSVEQIQTVLKWFEFHARAKFTPKVFGADGFRAKFPAIEAARDRDVSTPPPFDHITPETVTILDSIAVLEWPGDEKKFEAEFVQRSIGNYRQFLKTLEMAQTSANISPLNRIHIEHLYACIATPAQLAVGYLCDVHKVAHTWRGWRGDLLRWVWTPNAKLWRDNSERALVAQFGGWDIIDLVLNAN